MLKHLMEHVTVGWDDVPHIYVFASSTETFLRFMLTIPQFYAQILCTTCNGNVSNIPHCHVLLETPVSKIIVGAAAS